VARLAVLKFVNYMNASADVLALASIEVPVDGIPDGGCIVVKYDPLTPQHLTTTLLTHATNPFLSFAPSRRQPSLHALESCSKRVCNNSGHQANIRAHRG
jgi:hypothetical protein